MVRDTILEISLIEDITTVLIITVYYHYTNCLSIVVRVYLLYLKKITVPTSLYASNISWIKISSYVDLSPRRKTQRVTKGPCVSTPIMVDGPHS